MIIMENISNTLTQLQPRKKAKIVDIEGGNGFQRKMRVMGIREGQIIMIISKQPFHGPLTIKLCGTHMTLGRGIASKIIVEAI